MKAILYIVALVTIVAAAFFTMQNIAPHEEQLQLTSDLEGVNVNLAADIVKLEGEFAAQRKLKNTQQDTKNELVSNIGIQENEHKDLVAQSAGLDNKLEVLVEKKEEIDDIIAALKKVFEKENIPLEDVAGYFDQMAEEKKQLNKAHGDLLAEVERFNGIVTRNNGTLSDFSKQRITRRNNLKANGVSSLITAVDNDWGFVVIKPHGNANIKETSKLIVIRGDKHVGRLSINAIENGRILANIDYKSLVSGMRIRPGDRVILSRAVTQ